MYRGVGAGHRERCSTSGRRVPSHLIAGIVSGSELRSSGRTVDNPSVEGVQTSPGRNHHLIDHHRVSRNTDTKASDNIEGAIYCKITTPSKTVASIDLGASSYVCDIDVGN